jgi:hypothetical protein
MPLQNFTTYKQRLAAPYQQLQDSKNAITTVAGRMFYSSWLSAPFAGNAPTTPEACSRTTVGALGQADSSLVQRLAQVSVSMSQSGYVIIADRLSHMGGLSAASTALQSVNTAALTRYTDGVGVMASIDITSLIGTTATTCTVNYTNDADQSRTSEEIAIGATNNREASRSIVIPWKAGDRGIKSVQSITLLASTTLAGAFGITLWKPLFAMPIPSLGAQPFIFDSVMTCSGNMPIIQNGACLYYLVNATNVSTGIYQSTLQFIEEPV